MRKSERLRQAELQLVKLELELEMVKNIVFNLVDAFNSEPDMEAGKWYVRKPQRND